MSLEPQVAADTGCSRVASVSLRPMRRPTRRSRRGLLAQAPRAAAAETRIDARATRLIEGIRAQAGGLGGIEDFLHAYSLSTKEGLALMVLAEALLRVPDAATADRLIEDKLATGDWSPPRGAIERAAGVGLGLDARHHRPHHPAGRDAGEHPREPGQAARPAGGAHRDAAGDAAARLAFRARADHRGGARSAPARHPRVALFLRHARRGRAHRGGRRALFRRLCARHRRDRRRRRRCARCRTGPAFRSSSRRCIRASRRSRARACWPSWCRDVLELARKARDHDLNFTVDAEEADRLELSLDVIAAVLRRSVAARLGGLRARRAGLSEARAGGDRLARRRPRARSAAG